MSHFVCPLCGKNAPISTFDPSSLDLDLRTVSFRGLGRGMGFEKIEETSVLGDDEITPAVAERVVDLCKMLLNEEIIDGDNLLRRLELKAETTETGDRVKKEDYDGLVSQYDQDMNAATDAINSRDSTISSIQSELQSEKMAYSGLVAIHNHEIGKAQTIIVSKDLSIGSLQRDLQARTEEAEFYRNIEMILTEILSWLNPELIDADQPDWTVSIIEVEEGLDLILTDIISKLPTNLRQELLKRIKIGNPLHQEWFESLISQPREKSAWDKLLEIPTNPNYVPVSLGSSEPSMSTKELLNHLRQIRETYYGFKAARRMKNVQEKYGK